MLGLVRNGFVSVLVLFRITLYTLALTNLCYFYFFVSCSSDKNIQYTIDVEALKSLDKYTIDLDKDSLWIARQVDR